MRPNQPLTATFVSYPGSHERNIKPLEIPQNVRHCDRVLGGTARVSSSVEPAPAYYFVYAGTLRRRSFELCGDNGPAITLNAENGFPSRGIFISHAG